MLARHINTNKLSTLLNSNLCTSNLIFKQYLLDLKRNINLSCSIQRQNAIRSKKSESNSSNKQVNVLNNTQVASTIANILGDKIDIKNKNSVIFDTYSGHGYVSEKLLKNGANRVISWEPRDKYWEELTAIGNKYKTRFLLKKKCFLRSKRYSLTSPNDLDKRLFESLKPAKWHEKCNLSIIGGASTIGITMYASSLVYSLSMLSGVSHYGRVQHYLMLTGMEIKLLQDMDLPWQKTAITRVLLYKIFFEFEIIDKVSLSNFTPSTVRQGWKYTQWDSSNMYLTRLSIRPDVFSSVCPQKDIAVLVDMLCELNKRKHERIIPLLDHWFPGFGIELLKRGYTMLDIVKFIPMDEIMSIYKCILTNPVYLNSSFRQAVDKEDFQGDFFTNEELPPHNQDEINDDFYPNK